MSGCMLGKAVELFSMRRGHAELTAYLKAADALPLRSYVPYQADAPELVFKPCCRGHMQRSEPDDDVNYSVLALMMLEQHGADLTTEDVARAWMQHLPVASTYTAERAAYKTLLARGAEWFPEGRPLGFDIAECSDNPYNDWIGAQIRADVYGWVCPGDPERAAHLVTRDAQLSHRGEGVYGAVFVAVLGALLAADMPLQSAVDEALDYLPAECACADAVFRALSVIGEERGCDYLREHYADMGPVHTVNNLALVVWALVRHQNDFGAAIGDVVAAGLDTDCNGATVGALWALQGKPLPGNWVAPWQDRVGISLAGLSEFSVQELTTRTVRVAQSLAR